MNAHETHTPVRFLSRRVAEFFRDACPRPSCEQYAVYPRYDVPADWINSGGTACYVCPRCGRSWRTSWALWLYYGLHDDEEE